MSDVIFGRLRRDGVDALAIEEIPGRYETAAAIRAEFGDTVADAYLRASLRTGVILVPVWPCPVLKCLSFLMWPDTLVLHPDSDIGRVYLATEA